MACLPLSDELKRVDKENENEAIQILLFCAGSNLPY